LKENKVDFEKLNPKVGVSMLEFSKSCKYFFSKVENIPNVLWIWETKELKLFSILIQLNPIKTAKWKPNEDKLVFSTGTSYFYLWSEGSVTSIDIPIDNFKLLSVSWNNLGDRLLLKDENTFTCCLFD
jgi:hypothetical protein